MSNDKTRNVPYAMQDVTLFAPVKTTKLLRSQVRPPGSVRAVWGNPHSYRDLIAKIVESY
jgi:hypothetical protein